MEIKSKKKRKSRYKTGIHLSVKCKEPVKYRSGWEKLVCMYFDNDQTVVEYFYEKIKISYVANVKTGKTRVYYPDFFVVYNDGTKKMIEVKRENQLTNIKVIKKAEAAKSWCQKYQVEYEFLTDKKVKEIQKMFSVPKKPKLAKKQPKKRVTK